MILTTASTYDMGIYICDHTHDAWSRPATSIQARNAHNIIYLYIHVLYIIPRICICALFFFMQTGAGFQAATMFALLLPIVLAVFHTNFEKITFAAVECVHLFTSDGDKYCAFSNKWNQQKTSKRKTIWALINFFHCQNECIFSSPTMFEFQIILSWGFSAFYCHHFHIWCSNDPIEEETKELELKFWTVWNFTNCLYW